MESGIEDIRARLAMARVRLLKSWCEARFKDTEIHFLCVKKFTNDPMCGRVPVG